MLPILLDLRFIKIYTFGVFLVLAFFWSTFLLWRNIRLTSYKEETVFDGLFLSILGGLFMGRLIYVILHFEKFGFDILKFILINGYPGLSIYGCLLGAFITFFIFMRTHKVKFRECIDYVITPLFIALGIGKLGSFFSAAEVGTKTNFLLSFKFVNFDGLRHLTPLYESILFFIGALISYKLLFSIRRDKLMHGITFSFFCFYFSLVYLVFDPLKHSKMMFAGQSVNWLISLSLLLTSSLYILYHLRSKITLGTKIITNSLHNHAKQNHTDIHHTTTEKVRGRAGEDSATDSEAQS